VRTPSGEAGLNYLCPGLKLFYAHIQRDLSQVLRQVSKKLGRSPGENTAC